MLKRARYILIAVLLLVLLHLSAAEFERSFKYVMRPSKINLVKTDVYFATTADATYEQRLTGDLEIEYDSDSPKATYYINVDSTSSFSLKASFPVFSGSTGNIPYTVSIVETAGNNAEQSATVTPDESAQFSFANNHSTKRQFKVDYSFASGLPAGSYTSTVTVEVSAS